MLSRTRVYMCLLSHYLLAIINVVYGFYFALNDQLFHEKSNEAKTSITNTNNISRVERDCGGGGRNNSRRCTTAAIILIFETITNNFMTPSKKKCDVIITIQLQRDNPKLYDTKNVVTTNCQIPNHCIINISIQVLTYKFNIFELQQPTPKTVSIQERTILLILNMISPASTCMGTIHKYYEKIKDAVEDPKP